MITGSTSVPILEAPRALSALSETWAPMSAAAGMSRRCLRRQRPDRKALRSPGHGRTTDYRSKNSVPPEGPVKTLAVQDPFLIVMVVDRDLHGITLSIRTCPDEDASISFREAMPSRFRKTPGVPGIPPNSRSKLGRIPVAGPGRAGCETGLFP